MSILELSSLSDAEDCGTFCVDASSTSTLTNRQTDLVGFTFVRQSDPHCFCYFDKGAVFVHPGEDTPYAGTADDVGEGQVEGSDGRLDHVCYRNAFNEPSRSPTESPTMSPIAPTKRWESPLLFPFLCRNKPDTDTINASPALQLVRLERNYSRIISSLTLGLDCAEMSMPDITITLPIQTLTRRRNAVASVSELWYVLCLDSCEGLEVTLSKADVEDSSYSHRRLGSWALPTAGTQQVASVTMMPQ